MTDVDAGVNELIAALAVRVAALERRLRWDPDADVLESRLAELVRRLAPDVRRIRYTLGEDHAGDPAVHFRVLLADAACLPGRLHPPTEHIEEEIAACLGLDGGSGVAPPPYPYFNWRSESEQAQLKERSWE